MKYLRLYIIGGFPAIAISVRPINSLHNLKRTYHKFSSSTIIRFFTTNHKTITYHETNTNTKILIIELKGGE